MSNREILEEEMKTDMTPMIDCVFLLIIFFLCIDFKTLEAKLPSYLPKDRGSQSTQADPIEQLPLKIVCDARGEKIPRRRDQGLINEQGRENAYILVGHKIHWMLGPESITDIDTLKQKLERIAADPSKRVDDPKNPGQKKLMDVVIEPDVGAVYVDVAETVDVVRAAGFDDVNFGGGRGPARK